MKTVKAREKGGVPERVSDVVAAKRIDSGECLYCKKEEWKQQVRDAAKRKAEAAEKARKAEKEEQPKDTTKDKPRRR